MGYFVSQIPLCWDFEELFEIEWSLYSLLKTPDCFGSS